MSNITVEEIENLGFVYRNNGEQYGWFLELCKNRVLTWCYGDISLEFDKEDYGYNNTLFDFNVETIKDVEKIISVLSLKKNNP